MTKNHKLQNNITIELNGVKMTILNAHDINGNHIINAVGKEIKTVDLKVKVVKTVNKNTIMELIANGKNINTELFNNVFTEVLHVNTRNIAIGGGHNDATFYDTQNVNLIVQGIITVDKGTAQNIIEIDKKINQNNREADKLKKQADKLIKEANRVKQKAYEQVNQIHLITH